MDLATLLGLIGALGIVLIAMLMGGSVAMYFDVPSLLIVFVGSIFVVLVKFSLRQFLGAIKVALKAFSFDPVQPRALIDELVQIADGARKGGLLSLDGRQFSNDFLSKGVQLLADGHDRETLRSLLSKELAQTLERHEWGARIFKALGDVSPAMGMIGTLVGLVAMLGNMNDPKAIGPAMGIALLTTLYGAVLANMVALPIADKLTLRRIEEARVKSMIIDALMAIQAGQNPRMVRSMLGAYLPNSMRDAA